MSRELKVGIIASVVATLIIVPILQPLLRVAGRLVLNATGAIAVAYQDRLFAEAAAGEPNYTLLLLIFVMALMLSGMTLGTAVFVRAEYLRRRRAADQGGAASPERRAPATW